MASMSLPAQFRLKMEEKGATPAAIESFLRAYGLLTEQADFMIPESEIQPARDILNLEEVVEGVSADSAELLSQTVVIKLNGGLGTGMGLQEAKSLLDVKEGHNFLDLIVKQNRYLKENGVGEVKFLLMNSFSTSEGTLSYLRKYEEYADPSEVQMLQNFSPKVLQENLEPATWEKNPELEWCPPGHGDIYTALYGSGWLETLLSQGIKYAFISNSDNLGASLDTALLSYFIKEQFPFLMEVTRRTPADSKGGHLCASKDGQLLLREVAQCPETDLEDFQNVEKHQFFNTNNLWLRLDVLKEVMEEQGGVMPLPIITNRKTVDPRDGDSPAVFQLETAMGAAISCFSGAAAICVPRTRFAPVKTTADLLSLRSDVYQIQDDGLVSLLSERNGKPPLVKLSKNYKFVDAMEELGLPSLRETISLQVEGPVKFQEGVILKGEVSFINEGTEILIVESGVYENTTITA